MITADELKARALKALYNVSEIEDYFVQKSVDDAMEFSYGRAVADFFVEDFAYIRLKIYLKIELSAEDEIIYKEAIKAIKEADLYDEGDDVSCFMQVATKDNIL